MTTYLIRRFFLLLVTLFGICLISFIIASFSPGDPAAAISGVQLGGRKVGRATDEVLKHTRQILYLDHPRLVNFSPETRASIVARLAKQAGWHDGEYERDDAKNELTGEIGTAALDHLVPILERALPEGETEVARRRAALDALTKALAANAPLEPAIFDVEKIYAPRGPRFSRAATQTERARGWLAWAEPRGEEPIDPVKRLIEVLAKIVPPEDGGPMAAAAPATIASTTLANRVRTWSEWWRANKDRYARREAEDVVAKYLDAPDASRDAALEPVKKVGSVAAPELVSALSSSGERRRRAAFALSLIVHKPWDLTSRQDERAKLEGEWAAEKKRIDENKEIDARARARRLAEIGDANAYVERELAAAHRDQLGKWRAWWFRAEEQYVDFSLPRQVVRGLTQTQFGNWMVRLVRGLDFGESYFQHKPVSKLIAERFWVTFYLNLWALFFTYLFAIPIGIYSATHPRTVTDSVTTITLFLLYSLPTFWVGAIMILLLTGPPIGWDLFPAHGWESLNAQNLSGLAWLKDKALHMALPVACLTYGELAYVSRQMRAGMLEVIRQDYVRTARAKGLSEKIVVYKHALRNSLIPTITILAYLLPGLFGGSVIIEEIFSLEGLGKLMFESVVQKDLPVVMADVFISGALTLIGILLADIAYAIVDPRIELR